jgi:hypothetical protein
MSLICKIYGEKHYVHFKDDWVPLVYIIITIGSVFNWSAILSHSLNREIKKVQEARDKTRFVPPFYTTSYIMYTICAANPFLG